MASSNMASSLDSQDSRDSPDSQDLPLVDSFNLSALFSVLPAATQLEGNNDISPAAFSFLSFPSNIRDDIYIHLLHQQQPIVNPMAISENQLLTAGVRLLRTCSQVYEEAVQVLYGRNTIHLQPIYVEQILAFFSRVGIKNLSRISSLVLDFQYEHEAPPPPVFEELGNIFCNNPEIAELDPGDYVTSYLSRPSDEYETSLVGGSVDTDSFVKRWEIIHRSHEIHLRLNGGHLPRHREWFDEVSCVLGHLPKFEALTRLEIWFPDSQQFQVGYDCMTNDRQLLRKVLALTQISELKVHGIENLAALEPTNPSKNLSSIIAELNHNGSRRALPVEAGRPCLRSYSNWQLVGADRYRITLEFRGARACGEDRFSQLPAEIRAKIFKFALLDWQRGFYGRLQTDFRLELWTIRLGLEDYPTVIESSTLRPRYHAPITAAADQGEGDENEICKGNFTGFASLLAVSTLFHQEAVSMLYGHLHFSNWNFNGMMCEIPSRFAKVSCMVRFLDGIGPMNRRDIRHLRLCLDSPKPCNYPASDLCLHDLPNVEIDPATLTEDNRYTSDLYRLFILLQDIPTLHTLHLGLPKVRPHRMLELPALLYSLYPELPTMGPNGIDDDPTALAPNQENYLRLASQLKIKVQCLRMMAYSVDLDDAEYMARVFGAETVELGYFELEKEGAQSRVETEGWDYKDWDSEDGMIQKRLRSDNVTLAVVNKLAQRNA